MAKANNSGSKPESESETEREQPGFDLKKELRTAIERADNPASHLEADTGTFHPSQLSTTCLRQAYLSVAGLSEGPTGAAHVGTLMHSFVEEQVGGWVEASDRNIRFEEQVSREFGDHRVKIVGNADVIDYDAGVVTDLKTRSDLRYYFDPPEQRHLDQVHLYMAATGCSEGRILYASRKDWELFRWPADDDKEDRDTFEYDPDRVEHLIETRAIPIRETLENEGVATCEAEIPFDKCSTDDDHDDYCWLCDRESLNFDPPTKPV